MNEDPYGWEPDQPPFGRRLTIALSLGLCFAVLSFVWASVFLAPWFLAAMDISGRSLQDWRDTYYPFAALVPIGYFAVGFSLLGFGIARSSGRLTRASLVMLALIVPMFAILVWIPAH